MTARIRVNSVVRLLWGDDKRPERMCLCDRTDIGQHRPRTDCKEISCEAPVGKALLGKKPGDIVRVRTPRGIVTLEVLEVETPEQSSEQAA